MMIDSGEIACSTFLRSSLPQLRSWFGTIGKTCTFVGDCAKLPHFSVSFSANQWEAFRGSLGISSWRVLGYIAHPAWVLGPGIGSTVVYLSNIVMVTVFLLLARGHLFIESDEGCNLFH